MCESYGGRWKPGAAWRALAFAALGAGLAGCIDAPLDFGGAPPTQSTRAAIRREGVSLSAANVAILSIEGAPETALASFNRALTGAAAARDIAIVEPKAARYLVRGYLWANSTPDGAVIDYVWDIFTAGRERAQRISDRIIVAGGGEDPWKTAGQAALNDIAAKSADDLAAFLSDTPEAIAAGKPPAALPLSYAPVE